MAQQGAWNSGSRGERNGRPGGSGPKQVAEIDAELSQEPTIFNLKQAF
jgi:hypothetical protein